MRSIHSAPDMQDVDLIQGGALLRPIQPVGRGLRRFVLRAAGYDKLAQAWVRGIPHGGKGEFCLGTELTRPAVPACVYFFFLGGGRGIGRRRC